MIFESETADRYSEIAQQYRSDWRGELTGDLKQELIDFLCFVGDPPKKILDAGCGTGKAGTYFTDKGYFVTGLDLSPGMLKQAQINTQDNSLGNFSLVVGNMRKLPYRDESFDAVWCMAALVHLDKEGKQEAIREFARVTSKGGYLYLSVQNLLSAKHLQRIWQSTWSHLGYDEQNRFYQHSKTLTEVLTDDDLVSRFIKGYAFLDERHWFFPTKAELVRLVKNCGLKVINSNSVFDQRCHILAQKKND